jgi:hypothetical protein
LSSVIFIAGVELPEGNIRQRLEIIDELLEDQQRDVVIVFWASSFLPI